MCKCNNFQI